MICGSANEALPGLRHHLVSVDVEVKGKRYLVTVEESWTKATGVGASGIERYKDPKKVTLEFESLDEFFQEAADVFDGFSSREEVKDFDQGLLGDAMRKAEDQVRDVLLFGGAAHLDDSAAGYITIDRDEAKCRRLIKKAAEE